jgi:D-sedoheptulose 7-phosphate isomerase
VRAAEYAFKKNISVISLTGESEGDIDQYADINIKVPSNDTQRIQEMHILIGHILCDYIEKNSVN